VIKNKTVLRSFLCCLFMPAAGFAGGPALESLSRSAAPADIAAPAPLAPFRIVPARKEWTVMMYTNLKLRVEHQDLVKEFIGMERVGTTANVNLALQASRGWLMADRYLVLKSTDENNFTSPVLEKLNNVDGGNYLAVIDFVNWAKANFPARRYALILWGHGTGWEENAKPKPAGGKGMGYDWETRNHIRNVELRKILEAAGGVDMFLDFACQMQMAEVAYEMRGGAGLLLGSEELAWGPSYMYEPLVRTLDAVPDAAPAAIAGTVLDAYKKVFTPGSEAYTSSEKNDLGRTFSALDPGALAELARLSSVWTKAVISANETDAVKYAVANVLRFGLRGYGSESPDMARDYATFADLYHFVELTGSRARSADVKAKSAELQDLISKKLVVGNLGMFRRRHGDYEANAHGVSVEMIPRKSGNPFAVPLETDYRNSGSFAVDGGWADFLDWVRSVSPPH
jgi:hypothetical protein